MRALRSARRLASQGFTLLEVGLVLVIIGLLFESVIMGQELILNTRVRDIISQQSAAETAFLAFQDRFRTLPGDTQRPAPTSTAEPPPAWTATATGGSRPAPAGQSTRRSWPGST